MGNIEKSDAKIEKLKATIEKLTGEIAELEEDIKKLSKRLDEIKEEMKSETEKRDKQVEKFKKADKEYEEAIDAVEQAIEVLKESKKDMKNAKKNLVQVAALSKSFPANPQVQMISALLEQKPGKPAAYEYRSNDIIATLQELMREFKDRKRNCSTTISRKKAIFDELMVGLKNEKKFKEEEKKEKTEISAEKTEEKEAAEEDKEAETKARDADQEFLDELTKQCGSKAEEWDQRSKTRSAELTAIAEATELLKSGVKDNYAANKKLAGLQKAAKHSPASFLQAVQVHAGTGGGATITKTALVARALQLLDARAAKLDSPGLVALAAKVAVHGDQFAKVKELINDLISKLEKQAKDESDQKSFCDKEMKKALESRDGEALSMEENSAKVAKKTAEVKELKRDIADLSEDIAELARGLNEATELRADEKKDNKKTLDDAKAGKAAVEQAIEVLQGFYELLQKQRDPVDRDGKSLEDLAPKTSYKGDYKGKGDAGKGIIGIMEIILEDFEKTIEDVESEESDAQTAFDELKKETEKSTEKKVDEKEEKEKKLTRRQKTSQKQKKLWKVPMTCIRRLWRNWRSCRQCAWRVSTAGRNVPRNVNRRSRHSKEPSRSWRSGKIETPSKRTRRKD